jgi:hypothetical protein
VLKIARGTEGMCHCTHARFRLKRRATGQRLQIAGTNGKCKPVMARYRAETRCELVSMQKENGNKDSLVPVSRYRFESAFGLRTLVGWKGAPPGPRPH